ncbi:chitinase-3-like protein 1 [Pantherophis guttatus]|uniref:Chitinase-3-like protein 1 n=1 Tax=Pantherophis guttatus TaxID=94885 RepID=A0ABM3ZBQ1_PANGU|nr:chitinase-3-like protein 1 [Pantherophis guttatus]
MAQLSIWIGIATLIFLQNVSAINLVCYFTSWSQYREAPGGFVTDDIEPDLCTHIIYAFANISGNQITKYEWNDDTTYNNLRGLKTRNPKLKILLSVGGANLGSRPFQNINSSPATRSEFVASVISFLRKNNFDGIDVAWHRPSQNNKRDLVKLVQDLNVAFRYEARKNPNRQNLILSVAVPAGKEAIDSGFDIPNIARFADFLNVMTFDFHGYWPDHSHPYTGHGSPLRKSRADKGAAAFYNVDYAVRYLKTKGAPNSKIIMGIPTYGHTFTLSSAQTGLGAPASGPGLAGPFTKTAGILAYYEICSFNHGATIEKIEEQSVPYSYKGNQWVGYEDETSVQIKVQYAKNNNLGGVMVWTLDQDDFSGTFCKNRNYPLLAAIKKELNK